MRACTGPQYPGPKPIEQWSGAPAAGILGRALVQRHLATFAGARMTRTAAHRVRLLALTALILAAVAGSTVAATPASAVMTYPTTAPMILNNVSPDDLLANYRGVCNGSFKLVIRGISSATNALRYLDAAQRCGLKAVLYLSPAVSGGTVYPSRVGALVRAVKSHPALYGYLTVKEPSWVGISASEIRSLYKAVKAADTTHPVVALFGDIPHFGDTSNPYTDRHGGHRDRRLVPGRDGSGGCSSSRHGLRHVRPEVVQHEGVPQGPRSHAEGPDLGHGPDAQIPRAELPQEAAPDPVTPQPPGPRSIHLRSRAGIAFHTLHNTNYTMDERRDADHGRWMKQISGRYRGGDVPLVTTGSGGRARCHEEPSSDWRDRRGRTIGANAPRNVASPADRLGPISVGLLACWCGGHGRGKPAGPRRPRPGPAPRRGRLSAVVADPVGRSGRLTSWPRAGRSVASCHSCR